MRALTCALLGIGLLIGIVATALGLLAPWNPRFELLNHARPFGVACAIALFVIAAVLRLRRLAIGLGALSAVNLALFLLPVTFVMPAAEGPRTIRITTLNLWIHNGGVDRVAAFLRHSEADVILLQEIGAAANASLLPRLADLYPNVISCRGHGLRCDSALLSKRPWTEIEMVERRGPAPPMIRARFVHDGLDYDVAGVHLDWPFLPIRQAVQVNWLIYRLSARPRPLIIAGDFNLTPFSWGLTRLAAGTGLKRVATFGGSWSTRHAAPAVLIDHVFASDEFRLVQTTIGPEVGSDHLPVTADLAFRRTKS